MFCSRIAKLKAMCPAVCVLLLACCMSPGVGAQDAGEKNQPTSFWMQKKLEYSKNILAGIASADFDKLVENAESMRRLNAIEGFIRGRTHGYRTQIPIVEESDDVLMRQAKEDNVEGAALAFTQRTIS